MRVFCQAVAVTSIVGLALPQVHAESQRAEWSRVSLEPTVGHSGPQGSDAPCNVEDLKKNYGDRSTLLGEVRKQLLVEQDDELAEALADNGEIMAVCENSQLYELGDVSTGMYLILEGGITISRHGLDLTTLPAPTSLGTWPLLGLTPSYDVSARAATDTALLFITNDSFRDVGSQHCGLWERLALTQAKRLQEANERFLPANHPPRLLIGSTAESLPAARDLKALLLGAEPQLVVELWTEVFTPGQSTLESLTAGLNDWDFAVFLVTPDDVVESQRVKASAPRDNIVFEAGLCMGRLGHERTLLLQPSEPGDLKVLSDLEGVDFLIYAREPNEVIDDMLQRIGTLGPRTRLALDEES